MPDKWSTYGIDGWAGHSPNPGGEIFLILATAGAKTRMPKVFIASPQQGDTDWEETPRKTQYAWDSRMREVMRYFWQGGLFGKFFEIGMRHDAARQNAAPVLVRHFAAQAHLQVTP